ncbi:uncharacterized protein CLUP02_07764 [Colletotrichum lupini]|uniref:Uncharacterized protein n=1 Tax=Colletotrichum lupini TaxID=145971 RepID=A0A9Q8STG9_9PEZI|nr:uncharacterized protein CLUP02_07764 [Colletotrichum lupini]UQC82277.1 hypothetical protein CLUP02_07764 [Colletotrichum lupini]
MPRHDALSHRDCLLAFPPIPRHDLDALELSNLASPSATAKLACASPGGGGGGVPSHISFVPPSIHPLEPTTAPNMANEISQPPTLSLPDLIFDTFQRISRQPTTKQPPRPLACFGIIACEANCRCRNRNSHHHCLLLAKLASLAVWDAVRSSCESLGAREGVEHEGRRGFHSGVPASLTGQVITDRRGKSSRAQSPYNQGPKLCCARQLSNRDNTRRPAFEIAVDLQFAASYMRQYLIFPPVGNWRTPADPAPIPSALGKSSWNPRDESSSRDHDLFLHGLHPNAATQALDPISRHSHLVENGQPPITNLQPCRWLPQGWNKYSLRRRPQSNRVSSGVGSQDHAQTQAPQPVHLRSPQHPTTDAYIILSLS